MSVEGLEPSTNGLKDRSPDTLLPSNGLPLLPWSTGRYIIRVHRTLFKGQATWKRQKDLFPIGLETDSQRWRIADISTLLYHLTLWTKIKLVVETAAEKLPLPEAPISITVMAYLEGFQVLITKRMGEQSILSQIPGIVGLVKKLEEAGFEPARGTPQPILSSPELKESGKDRENPICVIHKRPMVWREGENKQTGKHYAFWTCPEKNPDGSFCKYKPQKSN